jgi:hypothetical protein
MIQKPILFLWLLSIAWAANADTVTEVRQTIIDTNDRAIQMKKTDPRAYSKLGALEFWSNGGLLERVPPKGGKSASFVVYTVVPKQIEVIPLVEGEAAIAHYSLEGLEQYEGSETVSNYKTRCTQAFIKEDGQWKIRSSHWSPIKGGEGAYRGIE